MRECFANGWCMGTIMAGITSTRGLSVIKGCSSNRLPGRRLVAGFTSVGGYKMRWRLRRDRARWRCKRTIVACEAGADHLSMINAVESNSPVGGNVAEFAGRSRSNVFGTLGHGWQMGTVMAGVALGTCHHRISMIKRCLGWLPNCCAVAIVAGVAGCQMCL